MSDETPNDWLTLACAEAREQLQDTLGSLPKIETIRVDVDASQAKMITHAYFTETDDMTQAQPTPARPLRNKSRRSRQVRSRRARAFVRTLARLNAGPLGDPLKSVELGAAQAELREQARASGALDELQRLQRQQYEATKARA